MELSTPAIKTHDFHCLLPFLGADICCNEEKMQVGAHRRRRMLRSICAVESSAGDVCGPDLPFSPCLIAAVQLHQTGHSSIAQHPSSG
ncbi:hypothetical protein [Marivita geojedonensis]|uniref:hypothetical protein n=1 Tax=Marivita geojedonensis TaxID=1123756 RepID=UPI00117D5B63|nr:hypothetical protein [Marivita geojedonensis]